jgi:hypothetical protein
MQFKHIIILTLQEEFVVSNFIKIHSQRVQLINILERQASSLDQADNCFHSFHERCLNVDSWGMASVMCRLYPC